MAKKRKTGKREPNGRLSRRKADVEAARFEDDARQTVWQARRRHLRGVKDIEGDKAPVSKDQAKALRLSDRGSILGNWMADGKLTPEQVRAGEDFCARYLDFAHLNGLPTPTAKIGNYGAVRGGSRPERLEAARRAKAAHHADKAILKRCRAGVYWAMRRACVCDELAPIEWVREGCRALIDAGR